MRSLGRQAGDQPGLNNYLGLTTHPKLREAALEAVRSSSASGSARCATISGTMSIHVQLEERIAAFKNVEACVVFQSRLCGQRRDGLGDPDALKTTSCSDELNHASIIDGCRLVAREDPRRFRTRMSRAREQDSRRSWTRSPGRKLLITDGVFSMDGDIGALPGLDGVAEAPRRHHDGGRCACFRCAGAQRARDDRSLRPARTRAHSGGYALEGDRRARRVRVRQPRSDRVPVPPRAAVPAFRPRTRRRSRLPASAAFDVLEQEPERIEQLCGRIRGTSRRGLKSAGFNTGISETPITPVIVGDAALAHQLSRELFDEGVLAHGHRVPDGGEGQGARAHGRDVHAYESRNWIGAGGLSEGGEGSWESWERRDSRDVPFNAEAQEGAEISAENLTRRVELRSDYDEQRKPAHLLECLLCALACDFLRGLDKVRP